MPVISQVFSRRRYRPFQSYPVERLRSFCVQTDQTTTLFLL